MRRKNILLILLPCYISYTEITFLISYSNHTHVAAGTLDQVRVISLAVEIRVECSSDAER